MMEFKKNHIYDALTIMSDRKKPPLIDVHGFFQAF